MNRRWLAVAGPVAIAVAGTAGCSDGGDDEPTFRELITQIEGGELTQGELARREEVATFLCALEDEVLAAVWDGLTPRQLEFQDVVFRIECPERLDEYARATGRFRVPTPD